MLKITSLLPGLIAPLLRTLAWTWRFEVDDRAGLTATDSPEQPPVIWVLWHNRLIVIPILYERLLRHRKGAALISRSKDGGLLANCIKRFGGETVRGSSSRGGSSALAALKRKLSDGYDVYITPDGPRGPRYELSPGAIWLAQASGARILRVDAESSAVWRLGRWDGFMIPKPFAKVRVTLNPLHSVLSTTGTEEFEAERMRLQDLMMAGTGLL